MGELLDELPAFFEDCILKAIRLNQAFQSEVSNFK